MSAQTLLNFEHVHLLARDMAAMENFVTKALGANLVRKRDTNGFQNWEYKLGPIGLFISASKETRTLGPIDHLGFCVSEIERAIAHLQSHGCVLEEGPVVWRDDLTFAYLIGPEGLKLELLQRSQ